MNAVRHIARCRIAAFAVPVLALCALAGDARGQSSVRTRTFAFGKPVVVLRGEVVSSGGGSTLSAGAGGTLALSISNTGQATARNTILALTPAPALKDLVVPATDTLADIAPGETRTVKIPLSIPVAATAQKGALTVTLSADPGSVSAETKVDITVRDVPFPAFTLKLIAGPVGVIAGEAATLRLRVTNSGTGEARKVSAAISALAGKGDLHMTDPATKKAVVSAGLGSIARGASREIPLNVNPGADGTGTAQILVTIAEERHRFDLVDTVAVTVLPAEAGAEATGFDAFRRGDYRRAAGFFEKIAAAGKASKDVYYALGVSYFKLQNRPRCLSVMQRASSMGSEDARTWLAGHSTTVETVTVTYATRTADPFEGYSQPIGLGILPFTDMQMHNTSLTGKLYDALRKKNKAFRIFPFSTIQSEQSALGLTTLAPSNKEILAGLERDLSMNFAVGGSASDTTAAAFTMQILRCRDGQMVYSQEFRTSATSTAVDDAVLFLLQGKVPLYSMSREVEVKLR